MPAAGARAGRAYRSTRSAAVLQSMHRSVTGRARSRAAEMGFPQAVQVPNVPVSRRASASLTLPMSRRSRSRRRSVQFRSSSTVARSFGSGISSPPSPDELVDRLRPLPDERGELLLEQRPVPLDLAPAHGDLLSTVRTR